MVRFRERWEQEERDQIAADLEKGIVREPEVPNEEDEIPMGTPDADISVALDISDVSDAKFDALAAHKSQIADSFWMKMGREQFKQVMGTEWFIRITNPQHVEGCVTDIFAGYR
jgi:LmbE family N-acetylglucosaminyl deacetylase